jgi:hypothetical protein
VRYPEGTTNGFLALRTLEGKVLASGNLTEVLHGNRVVAHLVFRFKDGSVDDGLFSTWHLPGYQRSPHSERA